MEEVLAYTLSLKPIDAEFINPFLTALHGTLSDLGNQEAFKGETSLLKLNRYANDTMILIEINGEIHGAVILAMDADTTKHIASALLRGIPVDTLDDMVKSSLDEFSMRISEKAKVQLVNKGMLTKVASRVTYSKVFSFAGQTPFLRVPYTTKLGNLEVLVNLQKAH